MRTRCFEARAAAACALLALCVLAAGGCSRKSGPAPSEQAPPPLREWPQGRAAAVKITDQLLLSIPLQFVRSAIDPRAPASSPASFAHKEAHFAFFLPDFSGYTLANYRNEFDENKVEVVYLHAGDPHEAEPDAPGEYPPNMLRRLLKDQLNPDDYRDMYGLRCYKGRMLTDRLICYGRRDESRGEDIMLTTLVPPYAEGVTFPQMQARYFSRRFGGVRIAWRTHVRNLPRWREIDEQIWQHIEAWNVAPAAGPGAAPQAAQPPAPDTAKPR